MRAGTFRLAAVVAAAFAVLCLAATASAGPNLNKAPHKQILRLSLYVGPAAPLESGTVTVTDATGRTVATGEVAKGGGAILRVASGTRPFTVTTSGGTARGRAFDGHLQAIIPKIGRYLGPQPVSLATTVAARYHATYGGSPAAIEARVLKALGLNPRIGEFHLKHPTHAVARKKVDHHSGRFGGYDGLVDELVARLAAKKGFPDFTTTRLERPYKAGKTATRQSSQTSSVSTVPCGAQVPPPANTSTPTSVAMYSAQIAAGTATAILSKNPSLLLSGVSGMVFSNENSLTNAAMLTALQAQLSCISAQIAALATAIDNLTLISELVPLQTCEAAITTQWNAYESAINLAAQNPGNPNYALSTSNPNIDALFTNIGTMAFTTCNSIINQTLFNGAGGTSAAWSTIVSNYKKGDYLSTDSAALAQSSVSSLQLFLQYYGTLEYDQAALATDYYNWQQLKTGKSYLESQQLGWGTTPCMATASVTNVQGNATTWCQWQQNIIDVWPGNLYTDEVGGWQQDTTGSSYAVDGVAVSAVPGSWGKSTTSYTESTTGMNLQALSGIQLNAGSGTWNAPNALASYNNQPAKSLAAPYQAFGYRQASKTAVLPYADSTGYSALGSFFSSWLGYTVVNGVPTPCSSKCTSWQLLTNESSSSYFTMNGECSFEATRTTTDTAYSPSPWSPSSGKTSAMDPCGYTTPIAWLISRPWTQGGAWPSTPTITTSGVVAANATLTASSCPSSGCTWAITAGAPTGLTISSSGKLSWTGSAPGTTASIQVVAGGSQAFSAPVTLTVQLT